MDPLFPRLWLDAFAIPRAAAAPGDDAAPRADLGAIVGDVDDHPTPAGYADWFNARAVS